MLSTIFLISLLLAGNYDRILVVDISGSMKKNNLHERVKSAFRDYVKKCAIGDRIILMTFGTDVNPGIEDRVIQGTSDITELQNRIDEFQFNDQWTWMTKAFDVIFKRVIDLQKAYPDRPKYILIFTDGNNEPPPGHEDEFTFEQIIRKYADSIRKERTFLYAIMHGVTPSEELKRTVNQVGGEIITTQEAPPTIPELQLAPPGFKFSFPLKDTLKTKFELSVKKFPFEHPVPVYFEIPTNLGFNVGLVPSNFQAAGINQKTRFNLAIIGIEDPGNYRFVLYPKTDMRGVILTPQKLAFEMMVKRPLKIPAWIWAIIGGIIVVIGAVFGYRKSIPKFYREYLVQLDAEGREMGRWNLGRYQPTFSSTVMVSKNLRVPGLQSFAFALRKDRMGKIYIMPLRTEVKIGDEKLPKGKEKRVEFDIIFCAKDKKLKIEKIKRRV